MLGSRTTTSWRTRTATATALLGLLAGLLAILAPVAALAMPATPATPAPAAAITSFPTAGIQTDVSPAVCQLEADGFTSCHPIDVQYRIRVNDAEMTRPLDVGDVIEATIEVPASAEPFYEASGDALWSNGASDPSDQSLSIRSTAQEGVLSTPQVTRMARTDLGDRGSGPGVNCELQSGQDAARSSAVDFFYGLPFDSRPYGPVGFTASLAVSDYRQTVTGTFTNSSVDRCSTFLGNNGLTPGYSLTIRQTVLSRPRGEDDIYLRFGGLTMRSMSWGTNLRVVLPSRHKVDAPDSVVAKVVAPGTVSLDIEAPTVERDGILGYVVTPYLNGVTAEPARRLSGSYPIGADGHVALRVDNLRIGQDYAFTVFAFDSYGNGSPSPKSNLVRVVDAPDEPTNVRATPGPGGATVRWTNPTNTGGSPLAGWKMIIDRSDGRSFERRLDVRASEAVITGLEERSDYDYTFRVSLTNDALLDARRYGLTGASNPVLVGRPEAPQEFSVVPDAGGATASWYTGVSGDLAGVTGAEVTTRAVTTGAVVNTQLITFALPLQPAVKHTMRISGLTDGAEYRTSVRLRNAAGWGMRSSEQQYRVGAVPGTPTGLSGAPGAVPRSVALTWTNPALSQPLTASRVFIEQPDGSVIIRQAPAGSSYTVTDLPPGTYALQVVVCNATGCGQDRSTPVWVTTYDAPSAPPGLIAVGSRGSADVGVSWNPPANGGLPLTQYRVLVSAGGQVVREDAVGPEVTSHTVAGLAPGTYTFAVQAFNGFYWGPTSTHPGPIDVRLPPSAPALAPAIAGVGSATLSWTPPAQGGGLLRLGYELQPVLGTTPLDPIDLSADDTTATVDDLLPGLRYTFTIRARNGVGLGPASAPVRVTPQTAAGAPSAASIGEVTPGDSRATVRWAAPAASGDAPVIGYAVTVFRSGADPVTMTFLDLATTQVITGLTNGASYTFRVAALNGLGSGPVSQASAVVRPQAGLGVPSAPAVSTVRAGNATATVRWTRPTSTGGRPITGYVVTPYAAGVPQPSTTFGATSLTGTLTGLANGTAHRFTVAAVNAFGTSAESSPSEEVTPRAPAQRPGAPTIGTAEAFNTIALVRWTPPASDGGSPITGYRVTPYVAGVAQRSVTFGPDASYGGVTGLANETNYTFRVAAINAVGAGLASAKSNAVVPRPDPGTPAAPTITTLTPSNGAVTLSWTPPTDTAGLPVTGYRIIYFADGVVQPYLQFFGAQTTRVVPSLTNGTAYRFRVAAVNANGVGADSALSDEVVAGSP